MIMLNQYRFESPTAQQVLINKSPYSTVRSGTISSHLLRHATYLRTCDVKRTSSTIKLFQSDFHILSMHPYTYIRLHTYVYIHMYVHPHSVFFLLHRLL